MNLFKKKKSLKSLNELSLLQLPLERMVENNHVLGIKEEILEKYLIENNFNVYSSETLTYKDVVKKDLTTETVLITDVMHDLGFSMDVLDNDILLFYINQEIESRYIEVIQEVCGAKSGLNYSISDSEYGDLFSNIYVYDSEDNDKEYHIIYSFENDNYIVKKSLSNIETLELSLDILNDIKNKMEAYSENGELYSEYEIEEDANLYSFDIQFENGYTCTINVNSGQCNCYIDYIMYNPNGHECCTTIGDDTISNGDCIELKADSQDFIIKIKQI